MEVGAGGGGALDSMGGLSLLIALSWPLALNRASTKAAAWAGMTATPARIDPDTTSFPCQVIGVTSPKPTVVSVVSPTICEAKQSFLIRGSSMHSNNKELPPHTQISLTIQGTEII